MAVHSTVVANRFIDLSRESGTNLTQMHLQKLTYITHGWSLALNNEPLTSDVIKAYAYGPVYPDLGEELRQFGKDPIKVNISTKLGTLSDKQDSLLTEVHDAYGRFEAWNLSALTHKNGTPWSKIYKDGEGKYEEITNDQIKEHFDTLVQKATQ